MTKRPPLIKINVRISPSLLEATQLACENETRTFSSVVRLALQEWLEANGYDIADV